MKHKISLSPSIRNPNVSTFLEESGKKRTETLSSCSAMIKREEKGHRLGNFHNYYKFNPTSNRISILEKLDFIRYLREKLLFVDEHHDGYHNDNGDDSLIGDQERQSKRLKSSQQGKTTATSSTKSIIIKNKSRQPITYCDLGCNEGDLTICLSEHLIQPQTKKTAGSKKQGSQNKKVVENEGHVMDTVRCLGLDIDSTLIERANEKYVSKELKNSYDDSSGRLIDASFQICNIGNNTELISKCDQFLQSIESKHHEKNGLKERHEKKQKRFDLISIFSTTMWIHIHHGDDGLRLLLRTICSLCNYVLIEPQPSKCYRNVNTRLRKMNLEEVDVSLDRLKMRSDIENEIEKVILGCGFNQVDIKAHFDDNEDLKMRNIQSREGDENRFDRTTWNRTLRLYKRSN